MKALGRQAQVGVLMDKPPGGNAPKKKILARFVAHCESCAQDIENAVSRIKVWVVVVFERKKNYIATLCIFP